MQRHCEGNWSTAKRVLKYLKGIQNFGLKYSKLDELKQFGCFDPDFDDEKENVVST